MNEKEIMKNIEIPELKSEVKRLEAENAELKARWEKLKHRLDVAHCFDCFDDYESTKKGNCVRCETLDRTLIEMQELESIGKKTEEAGK